MKIIDLLNKIANGEEVPERIQVYSDIFIFDNSNSIYEHEETRTNLLSIYNGNILNYEVRIKEDKKIPEKIDIENKTIKVKGTIFYREKDIEIFQKLSMVINEIIDYLEEKE